MANLKNEYNSFLEDIEKNIKNKEDLEYIKKRFSSFLDVVVKEMDRIVNLKEEQMTRVERKQDEIEARMSKIEESLNHIEDDIYMHDDFDFEIICPYCDYDFVVDVDENRTEVTCPECGNVIELDWTGDCDCGHDHEHEDLCSGGCCGCHGCEEDEDYEFLDNGEEDDDM